MNAGRKLDALVAEKVMGWSRGKKWFPNPHNPRTGPKVERDVWFNGAGEPEIHYTRPYNSGQVPGGPPRFSTDISAAWEVVEKMQDEGWGWTADRRGDGAVPDDFAVAWRFHRRASIARADKPEAPLAICLASLKAKGVDV